MHLWHEKKIGRIKLGWKTFEERELQLNDVIDGKTVYGRAIPCFVWFEYGVDL